MTPLEKRKADRAAAKPEVLRLVKKYGRATVANILSGMREKEKAAKKIAALKREMAELEKRI
jgi:hypothetical protein